MDKGGKKRKEAKGRRERGGAGKGDDDEEKRREGGRSGGWANATGGSIVFSNLDGNPSTAGNSRVVPPSPFPPFIPFRLPHVPRSLLQLYLNSSACSSLGRKPNESAYGTQGFCAAAFAVPGDGSGVSGLPEDISRWL